MKVAFFIFSLFIFVSMLQGIGASAIRAGGRQKVGALITGVGYLVLGLPVTCMFNFLWREDFWE